MNGSSASVSTGAVELLLRELKLPSFVAHYGALAEQAEHGGWSFREYLRQLAELEVTERWKRGVACLVE